MKIGLTSDLHTDVTPLNKQILPHIVKATEEAGLDIFILAGDLSPKPARTRQHPERVHRI